MRRRAAWSRSWFAPMVAVLALLLSVAACGPEDARQRNGGLGGSSRPEAPPTRTSAPELIVQPTANQPYATEGPLATLPAQQSQPAASPTPGFAVPTTPPNTIPVTPGGTPAASPTR